MGEIDSNLDFSEAQKALLRDLIEKVLKLPTTRLRAVSTGLTVISTVVCAYMYTHVHACGGQS